MESNKKIQGMGGLVFHTGSTYTCNPPPKDTDIDYLIFCTSEYVHYDIFHSLISEDYVLECGEHYQDAGDNTFYSLRKGNVNYIVTKNKEFANKHILATEVCKKLNLMDKKDRILLFKAILYREAPEGVNLIEDKNHAIK